MALALAAALALTALDRVGKRRVAIGLAVVVVVGTLIAALLATGVPGRLLAPGAWGELRTELDTGLGGVSKVDLPYEGTSEWTRLGILLAAPLALVAAAALAFWPSPRPGTRRRGLALAVLVALYAVAVTWESPDAELVHGLGLLACIAAFLWLGRLPRSRALAAVAALVVAALAALPAAARVDTTGPLVNYAGWELFGDEEFARFSWDHSYGPLDWPQNGTELFEVRAERPLYWKTSVLDDFDGAVWTRVGGGGSLTGQEIRPGLAGASDGLVARRPHWIERFDVAVEGLRSELMVGAGTTLAHTGVAADPIAGDGTTSLAGAGLERDVTYTVQAYAPDPSAELLRRSDDRRYPRALERYTTLLLPSPAVEAAPLASEPRDFLTPVVTPLRGAPQRRDTAIPTPRELVAGTAYGRIAALARRITSDAPDAYAAVRAIERYLLENYRYSEEVPERRVNPLPAFLFKDRAGYCQHFSGAMALMLRLVGIPSRVATGFAPGILDSRGGGVFTVLDTDAHSWVEVWFPRVGWVNADPTPAIAPAQAESLNSIARTLDGSRGDVRPAFTDPRGSRSESSGGSGGDDGGGGEGTPLALLLFAPLAGWGVVCWRRRRRFLSPAGAPLQLAEFRRALTAMGHPLPAGVTLLRIERELGPRLGPPVMRYAAGLRDNRYRARRSRRPGPDERRELRGALSRGRGIRARLLALRAIPPGGPRRQASD